MTSRVRVSGYHPATKALHWVTLLAHVGLVAWRGLLPRMLPGT